MGNDLDRVRKIMKVYEESPFLNSLSNWELRLPRLPEDTQKMLNSLYEKALKEFLYGTAATRTKGGHSRG